MVGCYELEKYFCDTERLGMNVRFELDWHCERLHVLPIANDTCL